MRFGRKQVFGQPRFIRNRLSEAFRKDGYTFGNTCSPLKPRFSTFGLLIVLVLIVNLTGLVLHPNLLQSIGFRKQSQQPSVNGDYARVRLYTLANEAVALMTSMVSGPDVYGYPLAQHVLPHRALVFHAPEGRIHEVYPLAFAARTLGEWDQDIVVLGERVTPLQIEALNCLKVKTVDIWEHPQADALFEEIWWIKSIKSMNRLLFVYLREFREYDILQYLDLDTVIVGPIEKLVPDDFGTNMAILFEEARDVRSCSIRVIPETIHKVDTPNGKRIPISSCVSASSYAILTWNLERVDRILGRIGDAAKNANAQRQFSEEIETEAYALMHLLKFQWQVRWLGGVFQTTFSDPSKLERKPPTKSSFSFIYTDDRLGRPSLGESPYHIRYVFTTFLAGSYLRCHPSISSSIDPSKENIALDKKTIFLVKTIAREYIEWALSKSQHPPRSFKDQYVKQIQEFPNENVGQGHKKDLNRVLVMWASKGYVEGAYAVAFQTRTLGQWHQDLVLLTDEITEENRKALDCLRVKIVYYKVAEFKQRFPWVEFNHWYYKLLPFLLPELRKYDIVQYLDLDVVVVGPIKRRYLSDFDPGVDVLMEDNNYDTSILVREDIPRRFESNREEEVKKFIKRFPGADEPNNGPNQSPSAGACFYSFVVSQVESVEELYKMFSDVAQDYYKVLNWGDQPLIMLTFWGRWRMRYGNLMWQADFERVFDETFRHDRTQGIVRFVHTGGGLRPALPTSPYKPIEVFTNMLAADLLECPAILVGTMNFE